MNDIRIYKFEASDKPVDQRFDIVDIIDSDISSNELNSYREGYYCFLLLEKGEAILSINETEQIIKAPIVVAGLPGDIWTWKNKKNLRGKFICFEAPFIVSALKGNFNLEPVSFLNSGNRYPFIPLSYTRYHKLHDLVMDMEECVNEFPVFYDLIRVQLWQFIFLTEKEYILNGNQGREKETKNHFVEFTHLVNKYFSEHHDTRFYADKLSITPNYLNKICKTFIGINAYDYISNRIMCEAKVLLRLTSINVSELAYKLGYDNVNYFIKCFKKSEGETPGEYQNKGSLFQKHINKRSS